MSGTEMFTFSFFLQQNFKWEEQNYVVQNEINTLIFLVKKTKESKVRHYGILLFCIMHPPPHLWDYEALQDSSKNDLC